MLDAPVNLDVTLNCRTPTDWYDVDWTPEECELAMEKLGEAKEIALSLSGYCHDQAHVKPKRRIAFNEGFRQAIDVAGHLDDLNKWIKKLIFKGACHK